MEAVAMADTGMNLPTLSEELRSSIDQLLEKHSLRGLVSPRNPLDLTPAAGEQAYDDAVCAVLDSREVDVVVVSCVPLAPVLHTLGRQLDDPVSFPNLAKGWKDRSRKAIVSVFDGGPEYEELVSRVRAAGIPVFKSADEAASLIRRWTKDQAKSSKFGG
jgi:acyl-CoA synthetase (NDP forming)